MKKSLLYLAAFAGLTACVKDLTEEVVVNPVEENGPVLTISASVDDTQTRVITEDGLRFKFVEGDKIGVFFYNEGFNTQLLENVAFKAGAADEDGNFNFTQEESVFNTQLYLKQGGTQIFGYAPFTDVEASLGGGTDDGVTETVVTRSEGGFTLTRNFNIPSQQKNATDVKGVAQYYTLAANPASPVKDENGNFKANLNFSGIFALVNFKIINETAEEMTVTNVKYTVGVDETLTGLFKADLHVSPKLSEKGYALTAVEGRTNNYIDMTLDEPVILAAGESFVLYGVVNSGTYASSTIEAMATSNGRNYVYTLASTSEKVITRETRMTYNVRLKESNAQLLPSEGIEVINNVADLKAFAEAVNGGDNKKGTTVVLTADLDLAGETWTPIGTSADDAKKFMGTFEGQGHTISGLKVNQGAGYHAAGLFGALNGTVKDLVIDGAEISNVSEAGPNGTSNGTAVVAGSIYTSGLIQNVTVKNATVNGNRYVGGIAGYVYGKIEGCSVIDSHITATCDELTGSWDNGDKVGGIAGFFPQDSDNYIRNCSVENTDINGYRDLGGIVGYAADEVSNCTVKGVEIFVNTEHNYKNYTSGADYDANAVVGEGTAENSTISDVTVTVDMAEGLKFVAVTDANGVTAEEYQIASAAGLVNANDLLFANNDGSTTDYYKLMDSFSMSNINWVSKMPEKVSFIFDGNNKEIKYWNTTDQKALLAPSLRPTGDVTIKNLTLRNSSITNNTISPDGESGVGLLVGYFELHEERSVNIENCILADCKVETSANWAGAYVGYAISKYSTLNINNCKSLRSIVHGGGSVGGIIGHDEAITTIEKCKVNPKELSSTENGDWRVGCICGTRGSSADATYLDNDIATTCTYTQPNTAGHSDASKTYGDNDVFNYAFGRYTNGGDFTVEGKKVIKGGAYDPTTGEYYACGSKGLATAIAAGAKKVILSDGQYEFAAPKGGDLHIVGKSTAAIISIPKAYGVNGTNLTFDKVTLDFVRNTNYIGLQHSGAVTYNNCIIKGGHMTCYSPTYDSNGNRVWTTFNTCEFVQDIYDYHLWTYTSNVKFETCSFNCVGKAVKVYAEADVTAEVILNNCTFKNTGEAKKAAVEIDATYTGFDVYINGCREEGFAQGEFTTSTMYNVEGSKWNLYIDNVKVEN